MSRLAVLLIELLLAVRAGHAQIQKQPPENQPERVTVGAEMRWRFEVRVFVPGAFGMRTRDPKSTNGVTSRPR